MRIVESHEAFISVRLGRFTYHRKTRVLTDSSGLTLFTLKHVDSVIFEKLIVNSAQGLKSPNDLLIALGWPDRAVTLSSLTMKITSLRKMLSVTGYDIVSVKNVGYYIPDLSSDAVAYESEKVQENGEKYDLVTINESSQKGPSVFVFKRNTFTLVKYIAASFLIVIFSMIIINWDV